jgi:hypothetical protein
MKYSRIFRLKNFEFLLKSLQVDLPRKKETVILSSSGRSGSTWVQEIIADADGFRVMFEPFHPENARPRVQCHHQYIGCREGNDNIYTETIESVLSGRISNFWIDQDNKPFIFFPRRRFIKTIRANLFIAWLKNNYPHVKVLFLVRHPYSVARSRLNLGWGANLDVFFRQSSLMRSHFPDDEEYLRSISTDFGRQIAFWSIQNLVPLREFTRSDALAISYEDILKHTETELTRISKFLEVPSGRFDLRTFHKPSRTSGFKKKTKINLSDAELQEAHNTLKRFGLDRLYLIEKIDAPRLHNRDIFSEFSSTKQDGGGKS